MSNGIDTRADYRPPDGKAKPKKPLPKNKSREGKLARLDLFCRALASGMTEEEACKEAGIGLHTPTKWKYSYGSKAEQEEIRLRISDAKRQGKTPADEFPDFLTFRERHFAYMNRRLGKHPKTGQWTVVRAKNSWYQRDAQEKLERSQRLEVILPPAHIKTTMWAIERSVWDIMNDRDFRIMAVQKNQGEAKKLIASVQARLDHPYYHELADLLIAQGDEPIECPICLYFPDDPFKPETRKQGAGEKWGSEGFTVLGGKSGEKDHTMQAFGVGSQIQGVRADRIVLDDIQDPGIAMSSPADSQKLLKWVQAVILGRVYDYQQIVVLANFFAPDDFAHLLKDDQGDQFEVVSYPAILDEATKQVLCPETWTYAGLMQKMRQVGPQVWHYTWMQEEGSFENLTFKREVLEDSRDPRLRLGELPMTVSDVFVGVDPAISASGHCAIVVWGLDRSTHHRYLIDVFNKTGMRNWENVIAQVRAMCEPYAGRLRFVAVETNAQQGSLANHDVLAREVRALGARVVTYQTKTGLGARAEQDNYDITVIGSHFDGGLVTLPYGGDFEEIKRVDDYIDQLCQWRVDDQGHSIKSLKRDQVMATLFAESEAFKLDNKPRGIVQQFKNPHASVQWSRRKTKVNRRMFTQEASV